MNENGIFAARLRLRMASKLYSQNRLAKECGIERTQISKYLNCVCAPNARQLWRLCRALDCSADYLIGLSDYPFTADKILKALGK